MPSPLAVHALDRGERPIAIEPGIDEPPDEPTRQRYRELAVFTGSPFPRRPAEAL